MQQYLNKPDDYFTHARMDLISMIPKLENAKILEIGAGGGDTLLEIKRRGLAQEVTGIELNALPDSNQNHLQIDRFIIGNVEQIQIPSELNYFDVIICGDVFEHLVDPWQLVKRLSDHLKKGGFLITSIPNIRIKSALFKIFIKGDFRYTKDGTFDQTHLRFFCKKNMIDLLNLPTLQTVHVKRNFDFHPRSMGYLFNSITINLFEEFIALQFLFLVKKTTE